MALLLNRSVIAGSRKEALMLARSRGGCFRRRVAVGAPGRLGVRAEHAELLGDIRAAPRAPRPRRRAGRPARRGRTRTPRAGLAAGATRAWHRSAPRPAKAPSARCSAPGTFRSVNTTDVLLATLDRPRLARENEEARVVLRVVLDALQQHLAAVELGGQPRRDRGLGDGAVAQQVHHAAGGVVGGHRLAACGRSAKKRRHWASATGCEATRRMRGERRARAARSGSGGCAAASPPRCAAATRFSRS